MASQIFSYSVQKEEDIEMVEQIKEKYAQKGITMSWIILQALKAYEKEEYANTKK